MGSANIINSGVKAQLWIICLWIFMILTFFVTFSASCSNKKDTCLAGEFCDTKQSTCIKCSIICDPHHDSLCSSCETHCDKRLLEKCRNDAQERVRPAITRPQPTSTDLPCQKVLNTVSYVVVGFVILAVIVVFAVALFYIRRELLCRQRATYDPSQYGLEESNISLLLSKCAYPLQRSLSVQADVGTLGVRTRDVETQTSILSLSMPRSSYQFFNQSLTNFLPAIPLPQNDIMLSEPEARSAVQDNFVSIEHSSSYDKLKPSSPSYAHLGDEIQKGVVIFLVMHESVFSFCVNDNCLCVCIFDGTSRSVEADLRKALRNMYSDPFKIMRGTPKTMSTIPQADL